MSPLNMSDYLEFIRLNEAAEQVGLSVTRSKYGGDELALSPTADNWPHYVRDYQLTTGNSEQLRSFLYGLNFAKQYYQMLGLVSDAKIARKEQDEKNRNLAKQLKEEVE